MTMKITAKHKEHLLKYAGAERQRLKRKLEDNAAGRKNLEEDLKESEAEMLELLSEDNALRLLMEHLEGTEPQDD
jgi:hypothetical protein